MNKKEKTALIATIVTVLLTVLKFILASLSGSIALLAEAWHSFSDILSSVFVFWAIYQDKHESKRQKDEEGEARGSDDTIGKKSQTRRTSWDNRVALVIGFFLLFIAIGIMGNVISPTSYQIRHPLIVSALLGIICIMSYFLYRFEVQVGEKENSAALIADGNHSKVDMYTALLVLISLLGSYLGIGLDRAAAGIIGLFILLNSLNVLYISLRSSFGTRDFSKENLGIIEGFLVKIISTYFPLISDLVWRTLAGIVRVDLEDHRFRERIIKKLMVMVVLAGIVVYLASGFYSVGISERAIVERLGKPLSPDNPIQPGIHYALPYPIDKVFKADCRSIRRMVIGYKTDRSSEYIFWTNAHYREEFRILTGENTFLDFAMHLHYRISDLYNYLYSCSRTESLIAALGYWKLRDSIGSSETFKVLTFQRDTLEEKIKQQLQSELDSRKAGIEVVNVCFRDIHPPIDVAPAFEEVVSAQEEYETFIEQARGYTKNIIPQTRAQGYEDVQVAVAFRHRRSSATRGEVLAFQEKNKAFKQYKEILEVLLYLNTLEETLPGIDKVILPPSRKGNPVELWLGGLPGSLADGSKEKQ